MDIFKIFYDENGRFIKATKSSIFAQSDNADIVQFKLPFANNDSVVSCTLLLPYPRESNKYGQYVADSIIMHYIVDQEDNGAMWEGSFSGQNLQNPGTAYLSARVMTQDGTVIKTAEQVQFIIEETGQYQIRPIPPEESDLILREFARIGHQVGINQADILDLKNNKQDKIDDSLETESNSVVGAINEVNSTADANRVINDRQDAELSQQAQDIQNLKETVICGNHFIDVIEAQTQPSDTFLTSTVQRVEGRLPRENDYIEWRQPLLDGTFNTFYIFYKTIGGWSTPILQPAIQKASNERYGTIKGGYNIDESIETDIVNGKINNIRLKDGNYFDYDILKNKKDVDDIVAGNLKVGLSEKTLKNKDGENIIGTYARVDDVYTRAESDSRYLPSSYSKIYYYSSDGIVENVPTQAEPQFNVLFNLGETLVFDVERVLESEYTFTKNSSDNSNLWIATEQAQNIQLRLVTKLKRVDAPELTLSIDVTGFNEIHDLTEININSIYNELSEDQIIASEGDIIEKILYVEAQNTLNNHISIYSNNIYPSTYRLATQEVIFDVNKISGKKAIKIRSNDWQLENGRYKAIVTREQHKQAPSQDYGLDLQADLGNGYVERIPFSAQISETGDIVIYSLDNVECKLLIWSAFEESEKEILTITDPSGEIDVNYKVYSGLNIKTTRDVGALTLKAPVPANKFYSIFVSNDATSTNTINMNTVDILAGKVKMFVWDGTAWMENVAAAVTSEIVDDVNNRPLNETLQSLENYCNDLDGTKAAQSDLAIANSRIQGIIDSFAQAITLPNNYSADMFIPENHPTSKHIMGKVTGATEIPNAVFNNGTLELIVYDNDYFQQIWHPTSNTGKVITYMRGHSLNGFGEWKRLVNADEVNSLSMCPSGTVDSMIITRLTEDTTTLTAEENGYFVVLLIPSATIEYLLISIMGYSEEVSREIHLYKDYRRNIPRLQEICAYLPVSKGQKLVIQTTGGQHTALTPYIDFIHAKEV